MRHGQQDSEGDDAGTPARCGQPFDVDRALDLANRHWRAGQIAQAEALCRQVVTAWPGHPEALHLLGVIAYGQGEAEVATGHLEQACVAPGAPAFFHSNLAEMYRQSGRPTEAVEAARRAVTLDPGLAAAWNNLGIALYLDGKPEESRAGLERAVALAPDSAGTRSNLGNTLRALGDLDGALEQHLRALELEPDAAEVHSNLAATLIDLGRLEQAATEARRAITLNPRCIDAYINAAATETSRDRHEEALHWLDRALSFAPLKIEVLLARAHSLIKLGRAEEALDACERAIASRPDDGEAHNMRALALQALDRSGEALAVFDRAARLRPKSGVMPANKALLLMQLGRNGEALAAFDRALALQRDLGSAWLSRAEVKTFSAGDPDIAAMAELFQSGRMLSYGDRICLHFALGKACLDAGEDERAFAHFAEGARLKRAITAYDPTAAERWMAAIVEHFPAELFDRFKGAGDPSQMPIFVIGMPRSGTTLIERILASHHQVRGAGELPHMHDIAARVHGTNRQRLSYAQFVDTLRSDQLGEMGRRYLARIAPLAANASRVVDKMPANFLHAGLIHLILPGARIIHVRRDPMDTCLSCYTKLFEMGQDYSYDLAELGGFYRSYQALMGHWRRVLPPGTFMEIDYEAVVGDIETEARRLVDFCGLLWDESCLRFHEIDRLVRTGSVVQVRRPLYRSSVGRAKAYRRHLAPLQEALASLR